MLSQFGSPLVTRRHEQPAFPGEELVFVPAAMFPHRLGRGYKIPLMRTLKDVNGTPIKNLAHLVEVVRDLRTAGPSCHSATRAGSPRLPLHPLDHSRSTATAGGHLGLRP